MVRLGWLSLVWLVFVSGEYAGAQTYFRHLGGRAQDAAPLPSNFDKDAELAWKTQLGPGNSSPCLVEGRVIVTTFDSEKQELATVALDYETGRQLWRQIAPTKQIEAFHPVGSPASATPASNGKQIFSFFGSSGLFCYDLDGNLIWHRKLGPFQDEFGAASSPVLVGDLVILNEDHDVGSFLAAFDQETGKKVWQADRGEFTRSYSTPVIWNQDERPQVIVAGSLQLAGYDVATGKKEWWVNGLSRIVDSTPLMDDGALYVATWTPGGDQAERISMEPFPEALQKFDTNRDGGINKEELPDGSPVVPRFFRMDLNQDEKLDRAEWEKHAKVFQLAQNVAARIRPGGQGDVTDSNVQWVYRRGLPTVPSSVAYDGVLYMVKDSGIITSLDLETGSLLRQGRARGRGNYYASLVAGDGKVYLCSERGVVTVLKAGRKWELLSSYDFGERIMATPVLADGKILLRTDAAIYCFSKP